MLTVIQAIVSILIVAQFIFERILAKLNESKLLELKNNPPKELHNLMSKEQWERCTNYNLDKSKISFSEDFLTTILLLFFFIYFYPHFFNYFSLSSTSSVWLVSFGATLFLSISQLPTLYYDWKRQFTLEEKYEFNTNSKKNWCIDKIKELFLGLLLGWGVLVLVLSLYEWGVMSFPAGWWLVAFSAIFSVQILLLILWPKLILPLFNKLTPLEDDKLGSRLLALANKCGFEASTIEVIDGSKRSRHSNAFFTGFGKFRRIILYDTLLKQMNHEQVEAVLAHEIGHYKLGHIPKRICVSFISGLCFFAMLAFLCKTSWFYRQIGLDVMYDGDLMPVIVAFMLVGGSFTYWLNPITNYFSRKHEFEADAFAVCSVGNSKSLSSALRTLYVENLNYPVPHSLVSFFHYTHPTLLERENAMSCVVKA